MNTYEILYASLDWIVIATALIYVFLAARENPWCWWWGGFSCALWAYVTLAKYDLWFDAGLQVFYVLVSIQGWRSWRKGNHDSKEKLISTYPWKKHLLIIILGTIGAILLGELAGKYTPAAATYLDALTTTFAVIGTIMLMDKVLENWIYFIVVDLAYIYLYGSRGAWLFAILMGVYVLFAAYGYYKWRQSYLESF